MRQLVGYYKTKDELYTYEFDHKDRRKVLSVIGRQCLNPELSLDWNDALEIEGMIRVACKRSKDHASCTVDRNTGFNRR